MNRAVEVRALPDFKVWLRYADGTEGTVDLSSLVGRGVFAPLSDPAMFAKVHITDSGAVGWEDDQELCADSLYLQITGQNPADLFPSLRDAADA
ncbi:MAG: DUF2442 domain-containing protein [Candidatus Latescibacterota bacterium]|nr:MAG: DUF2442 domain-containing protein [Candidatus Latescibacterota bacterium]